MGRRNENELAQQVSKLAYPRLALLIGGLALVLGGCNLSSGPISGGCNIEGSCSFHIVTAISFATPPPASMSVGTTATLAADVTEEVINASPEGADWKVSCGTAGACGSFLPRHTASGVQTMYTAPDAVPAGGTVTIKAVATADSQFSASATVTITAAPAVDISFASPPPLPTLTTGVAANFAADVAQDPLSAGVDWTVHCTSAGGCGSFSPGHTASGALTTYTAPQSVPSGGTATVTAASTADPSKKVSAVITISGTEPAAFLCANCSYTFVLSGSCAKGPYHVAGVFRTDGMGGIITGEQDFVEPGGTAVQESITGGSYSLGPDGRGTITLVTNDSRVGVHGTETLGVVLISPQHALISEQDSFGSSSGTLDLQTISTFSLSTLAGAYTFVLSGQDFNDRNCGIQGCFPDLPFAVGGVMNVASPGVISQAGSVVDFNDGGAINSGQMHGSTQAPDAFGRVQITLSLSFFSSALEMAGYITDANHLKVLEIDNQLGNTSGVAIGQGAATGTLSQPQAFSGPYVFTALGSNPFGSGIFAPVAVVAGLTATAGMVENGISDVNLAGTSSSGAVGGTYSIDSSGTGRVSIALTGNNSSLSNFVLYLSGGTDPALVLGVDKHRVTSGYAYAQAAGPVSTASFSGPYALNLAAFKADGTAESDITGQEFADGAGNLSGVWDINSGNSPQSAVAATGNAISNGTARFTGSITTIPTATKQFSYYLVSPSQVVFIETDTVAVSMGIFLLQTPPF